MASDDVGPDIKYFQYSGYFDWPKLYKLLTGIPKNNDYKVFEMLYKDKSGKGVTERELKWYFEKKIDKMHKYSMNVSIQMWDCATVEITQNNEKKKMERGRLRITMGAVMENDFQGLFKDGIWKKLFPIYAKITRMEDAFYHEDKLHKERYAYLNEIKKFLDTETVD